MTTPTRRRPFYSPPDYGTRQTYRPGEDVTFTIGGMGLAVTAAAFLPPAPPEPKLPPVG